MHVEQCTVLEAVKAWCYNIQSTKTAASVPSMQLNGGIEAI